MTEKSMVKADFITSVILIVFGVAIVTNSLQMPTMADRNQSIYSAPGVVPGFIGVMLTLLSFAMFFRSLKRKVIAELKEGLIPKEALTQETTRRIGITLALCLGYALLLGQLWFPVPTFLFIFIFITLFEYDFKATIKPQLKKLIVALVIALISTALVTIVFQKLFLVKLP